MLSGLQFFESFDQRLSRARADADAAAQEAAALASRREALRATEAELLRQLASLRLADTSPSLPGDPLGRLDAALARARAAAEARDSARSAADAALVDRRRALEQAQSTRTAAAARVHAAAGAAEQALAKARDRAGSDPQWTALRDRAEAADRVAQLAAQKAEYAARDRDVKGAPYLADPLFAYLWRHHWGTPRYAGGNLSRLLDGWTARVARYAPARQDFTLLTELPERLADHAARMRTEAEAATAALHAREHDMAGLPAPDAASPERAALDQAETALEQARAALAAATPVDGGAAAAAETEMALAMAALESALASEPMRRLREAAARTPTPDDDAIVARLEAAASERADLERALAERQAQAQTARARLDELDALRQEARTRGYQGSQWDFGSGAAIGVLLGEVIGGALSRDRFWSRLDEHRISGGAAGGSVWNQGLRTLANRPAPGGNIGSGGFGGGGFSTGGRMEGSGGSVWNSGRSRTGGGF